ncbi:hypothetical protein AAC387_Pa05g0761 [Persea americana]
MWHFMNTTRSDEEGPFPIKEAFESFCDGVQPFGPMFDHVLEYWKVSLEKPGKIHFLNYEEMKHDPKRQVKRLAEFLGRPFDKEEEVETVLWRCSLERLKSLDVNRKEVDPWIINSFPKSLHEILCTKHQICTFDAASFWYISNPLTPLLVGFFIDKFDL